MRVWEISRWPLSNANVPMLHNVQLLGESAFNVLSCLPAACSRPRADNRCFNAMDENRTKVYDCFKKFENICVGYGHKYDSTNFSFEPPPPMLGKYVVGADVTEAEDPSVEEEATLKAAQQEAAAAA